jgi:hypothetical protein
MEILYDIDDLLGFASRNLYSPNDAIMDIQVNCGALPQSAHVGYWDSESDQGNCAVILRLRFLRLLKQQCVNSEQGFFQL